MRKNFIALCTLFLLPSLAYAGSISISGTTTSDWGTGFCENVTLKNTGTSDTLWTEFSFTLSNATMTSLWGGQYVNTSGNYTVKPASWNQKIPSGGSVDIGYCANGSGRPANLNISDSTVVSPTPTPTPTPAPTPTPTPTPTPISSRPTNITLNKEGLSLTSTVISDWNTGYCRTVKLENTSNTPITNWNISFESAGEINLWSAKKTKTGNIFSISPESWSANLGKTEFGFCAMGSAVDTNWQIISVEKGAIAPPPTPINGTCGSDNNATISYSPLYLCSLGTPSSVTGTGPWSWTCQGSNGGTNASCQASVSTTVTPPPTLPSTLTGSAVVIGYYPSWARYTYTYDKIDYTKLDIINHAFVFPSETTGIKVDADFLYPELVSSVHANGKKILVTVGNIWGDPVFGTVMSNPTKRQKFITTLTKFIADNNYDGVDVDWEFPNDAKEGTQFLNLIRDLKVALPGKLVTVAISVLPHDFDLATLSNYADYINIMTYDMEAWYSYAGHNAPLYKNSKMPIDASIDHYIKTTFAQPGIDKKKLILGVPLYGRKFSVQNPYMSAYGSTAIEYKDLPKDCTRKWDSESFVPYLSCAGYYVTYDDAESLRYKQNYAISENLGGIFFWALGQDNGSIISSIQNAPEAARAPATTTIAPTRTPAPVTQTSTLPDSQPLQTSQADQITTTKAPAKKAKAITPKKIIPPRTVIRKVYKK